MIESWHKGITARNPELHDIKVCVAPGCQRIFNNMVESADLFQYQVLSAHAQQLAQGWMDRAKLPGDNWAEVRARAMVALYEMFLDGEPRPKPAVSPDARRAAQPKLTVEEILAMAPPRSEEPVPAAECLSVADLGDAQLLGQERAS